MSLAATTHPTGTPRRTPTPPRTRSSAHSSPAKTGTGATSTRWRSSSTGSAARFISRPRRSCSLDRPCRVRQHHQHPDRLGTCDRHGVRDARGDAHERAGDGDPALVPDLQVEAAGEQVERLGDLAVEVQRRLEPARHDRRLCDDEGVPGRGAVGLRRDGRRPPPSQGSCLITVTRKGAAKSSISGA